MQYKKVGRKTRLDIQNYGCNGNLLCYHGVVERNRISFLQSHCYYYFYPRESFREGLCNHRRWFVCLFVCLSVCYHDN